MDIGYKGTKKALYLVESLFYVFFRKMLFLKIFCKLIRGGYAESYGRSF